MKKVIITGAAGGIGQALTNRLLKAGYQVIAVDNNKDKLGNFSSHPNLTLACVDVTDYQAVESFFTNISAQSLYGLVNNAGVYNALSLLDYDESAIEFYK